MRATAAGRMAIVLVTALGVSAAAPTALGSLLDDLSRYLGAAGRLMVGAIAGVDSVQAAQIPSADRPAAAQELRRISHEISLLRASQSPLVFDIDAYVAGVRGNQLDAAQRLGAWRGILSRIDQVSPIVEATLQVVETSAWLKVAISEQDRLALREVLLGRRNVLSQLRALPAPSAPEEIDRLDRAGQFYRQLMASLGELNAALLRATDRLTAG